MRDTDNIQEMMPEMIPLLRNIGDSIPSALPEVDSKSGKDIKLKLDRMLHEQIIDILKSISDIAILSEEDESSDFSLNKGLQWIVDPLDGSLNHFRGIPLSCISVALWEGQSPLMGAVYDYHRKELFTGIVGKGAWLNDRSVSVSNVNNVNQAVICTGFPSFRDYEDDSLRKFISYIQDWKKVRLFGSAALSLAYVSCGRVDGYIEEDIRIWDVAGGIAIVKAAGGDVYLSPGKKTNFVTAAVTNKYIPVGEIIK
jgi:myo-inositol-1(or 4)-monophosphatase